MLAGRAANLEIDACPAEVIQSGQPPVRGTTQDIRALVPSLSNCRGASDLRAWLLHFARKLGFYGARYVHVGGCWGGDIQPPRRYLTTSPRDEDIAGWLVHDPCAAQVRSAFVPFAWSTRRVEGLTRHQREWIESEAARGVSAGVTVPVQDSGEGPAYLSLFGRSEAEVAELVAEHAPELAFAGAQFHVLSKTLIPVTPWVPRLTKRELECLRLAAQGKTIAESGETLGVSGRTVEFHLHNASEKLGAESKLRAVVLALGNGLTQI